MNNNVRYEGVFFDKEDALSLFTCIRGVNPAHPVTPDEYHVTTAYRPEQTMEQFYGQTVAFRVIRYVDAPAEMPEKGKSGHNEGVAVEVLGKGLLQDYIRSLDKVLHITGSFEKPGDAVLTGALPFEQGMTVDAIITGTFGGYVGEGNVILG